MRAILVFCEGAHDIVFVQRSLGVHYAYQWNAEPFDKLPTPFGSKGNQAGFLLKRFQNTPWDTKSLHISHHPEPPRFAAALRSQDNETIVFIVESHGKQQTAPVVNLLSALSQLYVPEAVHSFAIKRYACAFLMDADDEGKQSTCNWWQEKFGTHFEQERQPNPGQWLHSPHGPVGIFVFHSPDTETGTLEHALEPIFAEQWPEAYRHAGAYLSQHPKQLEQNSSKYLKAAFTIAGQPFKPGSPLSEMLKRETLNDDLLRNSQLSIRLAEFLNTAW